MLCLLLKLLDIPLIVPLVIPSATSMARLVDWVTVEGGFGAVHVIAD